jgi:hypothetical protein
MTDSPFVFGTDSVAARLGSLEAEQRIMFAAYWAQRLSLAYQRLCDLERFGDPEQVQRCLDLVWTRQLGDKIEELDVRQCQQQLVAMAPDLELRPVLAYAGMEYTAAVWDALTALSEPTPERAAATYDAVIRVVEHFLMNRDHPWAVVATRTPDPFGLRDGAIWEASVGSLEGVLAEITAEAPYSRDLVVSLKSKAIRDSIVLANSMEQLSLSIKPRNE